MLVSSVNHKEKQQQNHSELQLLLISSVVLFVCGLYTDRQAKEAFMYGSSLFKSTDI